MEKRDKGVKPDASGLFGGRKGVLPLCALVALYCALAVAFTGCEIQDKQPLAKVGTPAPAFTLDLISGGTVSKDSLRDKPAVITFMASWCPCSNESAPVFREAYETYHPAGVEFVMVGIQDSKSKFTKFIEKEKFAFSAAFDKGDRIARLYGVNAPPTTFFIKRDGTIKRAFYGRIVEMDKLSAWIDEIVE